MPIYEYKCSTCHEVVVENKQPAMSQDLPICSICDTVMKRLYGSPGLAFKGNGFYSTDK